MGGVLIVRVTLLGQQRLQTGHTQALSAPAVLAQAVNSSPGRVVAETHHISPTAIGVLIRDKIVHPGLNQRVIFSQTEGPDFERWSAEIRMDGRTMGGNASNTTIMMRPGRFNTQSTQFTTFRFAIRLK